MHARRLTLALALLPGAALAADGDPFDPSGSLAHGAGGLQVESPTLTSPGISAGLLANIAESLVVQEFSDGSTRPVLDNTLALTLYGGYTFSDAVRVEAFVPAYGHADAPVNDFSGVAFGDLRLQAMILVAGREDGFRFGLQPRLTLPTGTEDAFLRRGFSGGLAAVVGSELDSGIGWAANLGINLSGSDNIGDVTLGSDADAKLGLWYRFDEFVRIGVEGQGLMGLSVAADATRHQLATGHLFAQITSPQGVGMTVGFGSGFGVGAPEYRLFAGLTYAPLDPDSDGDGLPDSEDGCPSDPEDFDGYDDADGCPDLDNDGDGLLDTVDECPTQAEDLDGFQDDDGCWDADNDLDDVPDFEDACPMDPGPSVLDGCPDRDEDGVADGDDQCPDNPGPVALGGCPDRDGDRVPDMRDECPDDPIPPDAVPENSNGCPARVYVAEGMIRITERINFDTGRATIRPDSYGLLDDIAAIFEANPQVNRVEVAGHTDDQGADDNNLRLSRSRAEAVVTYLENKGIDASRMVANGYGEERPIDTNRTTAGRANNRRVEFTILDQEEQTRVIEVGAQPRDDGAEAAPEAPVMERPTGGATESPWTQEPEAETEPETEPAPEPAPAPRPAGNPWGPR